MKKNLFIALMCVASLTIVTACGNGSSTKSKAGKVRTGDTKIDAKLEKAEKKISAMTGTEQAEATVKKMCITSQLPICRQTSTAN